MQILNLPNSRGLKIEQVQMLLHYHLKNGLQIQMQQVLFQNIAINQMLLLEEIFGKKLLK